MKGSVPEIIKNRREGFIIFFEITIIKKMKILQFFWIISFFIFVNVLIAKECEFTVQNTKNHFLLNGKWNFFRGSGIISASPELDLTSWKEIQIPFKWFSIPELKNYKGEIWIRCNLIFEFIPEDLYLDLGFIKEIDEVYWNGEKIGGMGNFEKRIPDFSERRIYSIPIQSVHLMEKNTLAIRIYGTFWNSGIPDIPKLYFNSNFIKNKLRFETIAYSFCLAYIFSSLFFLVYGIITSEKKINFYFSGFVLLLSVYYSILWGKRYDFFDNYIFSYIFELLCLIPLPILFYGFLKEWLKVESKFEFKILFYFTLILIILALVGFFIPYVYRTIYLHIITYLNLINIFFGLYSSLKLMIQNRDKKENRYLFYGLIGLIPFLLNDALIALDFIHTPRLFIFSFSIFMISYAFHLSENALNLKKQSEEKTLELRNLEKQKLNVIYNISNEFQSIFEEIKQAINSKKNVDSETLKLNFLLENIKILESLENQSYVLQLSKINLKEEIQNIIHQVLKMTKEKKSRIHLKFSNTQLYFWTDLQLFKIILYNLIENELLYSKGNIEIDIDLEANLSITIIDEGPGIPDQIQNNIFLKYYRGEEKNIPGSGIGLTIVKEGIYFLGGEIFLESKLGFYTKFVIDLPQLKELL